MVWHMRFGYAALALVLFRILWGLAGDHHARFASFVRGPRTVLAYLRGRAAHGGGHNPAGGWSVLAMLLVLLTQASTGLFASDDIATEGPLAKLVSGTWVSWATRIHHWNEKLILALVALHLAAIVYYALAKRDNLVRPMIVGDQPGLAAPPAQDDLAIRIRAAILLALSAALVGYVVNL
jgi:cytochrome b